MKTMTVSVSKGKKFESSAKHNNRKTNLQNASAEKKKKFYSQKGHQHIKSEYTYLNEDLLIKDPRDVYDDLFEGSIKKYNDSKTRNDRKIGKGKALTRLEKAQRLKIWELAQAVRRVPEKRRQSVLKELEATYPNQRDELLGALKVADMMTLREIGKKVTQIKHANTLGEALYKKQKASKKAATHQEFVIQIGNASDFNEIDENGKIIESYDRTDPKGIWQQSKRILEKYYQTFEKRNPNLIVTDASIHMDENCPHLHLQTVAWAETSKTMKRGSRHTGLDIKPDFDGALECEGYKRDPQDSRSMFKQFQHKEADEVTKIMQADLGVSRKAGKTNRLKDVHEYKEAKRLEAEQRQKANEAKADYDKYNSKANDSYNDFLDYSQRVHAEKKNLKKIKDQETQTQQKLADRAKKLEKREMALGVAELLSSTREDAIKKREDMVKARENAVLTRENNVVKRENALKSIAQSFADGFCQYITQDPTEHIASFSEFSRVATQGIAKGRNVIGAVREGLSRAFKHIHSNKLASVLRPLLQAEYQEDDKQEKLQQQYNRAPKYYDTNEKSDENELDF